MSGSGTDESLDVLGGLDQDHLVGRLAHGADDLVVPLVADQDDGVAFLGVADRLEMDLDDQRAGGVDGQQSSPAGLVADLRRDAVGAVEQGRAFGDLVERFDEDGAAAGGTVDDELVVHDLVIDVQRRPEELEGPLQALDRHVDPGAEAAGIRQDDLPSRGPWSLVAPSTGEARRVDLDQGPISAARRESALWYALIPEGKPSHAAARRRPIARSHRRRRPAVVASA